MAKVLVVGESWFVHTVHQKGFDSFFTSHYEEGAGVFLAALETSGHTVTYVPSHEIERKLPESAGGFAEYDVVVISDVGANSFQLPTKTFATSIASPDKTDAIREYVARGGSLLMIGGYLTFTGIDAKGRWGRTPLAEALPVTLLDRDDRVELPGGARPAVAHDHTITAGIDRELPQILGLNEVIAKDGSEVLITCAGYPLLVTSAYGEGRSAAFMTDIAPHWAPPEFLSWSGYATLFDNLISWLTKR